MPNEIIIQEEHYIDVNTETCHHCGVPCSIHFPVLSITKGFKYLCTDCDDKMYNKSILEEESKIYSHY
jgi:hypothetical protein